MAKLKAIRQAKKMRANEVAKRLGVSRITLWNYENGKRTPTFETLIKLAKLYGVSVADFVDEEKEGA